MDDTIFSGNDNPENNTPTEDNQPVVNTPKPAVPDEVREMIGEGKKYKTLEDALKSIPHAQSHISNLEKEMAEMREDLNKRLSAEEVLKKIQERDKAPKEENTTPPMDTDTLRNLVKDTYKEMTAEEKASANIRLVDEKMKEAYGEKAVNVLQKKAAELGVTVDFLASTAATSPAGFFKLVGLENTKANPVNQERRGSVNTEVMDTGTQAEQYSYKWFQKMRKENPREYYTPSVQKLMHQKANELGDAFYK
jgi:hypothetical protein